MLIKLITAIINAFFKPKPAKNNLQAFLHGPGTFEIDIVGESHYQDAILEICGGKTSSGHENIIRAALIHEDDNPYDNKAIRVDIQNMTVGYLSRPLARTYRKNLAAAGHPGVDAACNALITGGWQREGSEGHFGVRLDLPGRTDKPCPHCGEWIKTSHKKCRFCGKKIEPNSEVC